MDKHEPIRIGVAGLGRAFTLMLPTFVQDSRVELVAAADPHADAREQFALDFSKPAFASGQALCECQEVEWVYIATPHQFHEEHALLALQHGKHVVIEKPISISLASCSRMIEAAHKASKHVIVGHSHSFNTPILRTKEIIASGMHGAVRMISAINHTDFMYRARRAEELDTEQGGGVVFSQAAHQVDQVRMLMGAPVKQVWAQTGQWDAQRPSEGAYMAQLVFDGGAVAQLSYNGFAFFDSDVWMDSLGEMGQSTAGRDFAQSHQRVRGLAEQDEASLKQSRNYGGALWKQEQLTQKRQARPAQQHFGPLVISCERGTLRPTALGLHVYSATGATFEPWPAVSVPRIEVIDELYAVARLAQSPVHSASWASSTLAVCLAMLESARTGGLVQPAI